MIDFFDETWRLFRAENKNGCRLRWPWALLAVTVVAVFYCVIAPLRASLSWIGRQVQWLRWLRRLEFPTKIIFFSNHSASNR